MCPNILQSGVAKWFGGHFYFGNLVDLWWDDPKSYVLLLIMNCPNWLIAMLAHLDNGRTLLNNFRVDLFLGEFMVIAKWNWRASLSLNRMGKTWCLWRWEWGNMKIVTTQVNKLIFILRNDCIFLVQTQTWLWLIGKSTWIRFVQEIPLVFECDLSRSLQSRNTHNIRHYRAETNTATASRDLR